MSSILKILFYTFGTILITALVTIAIAPPLLSSSWGQKKIINYINRNLREGSVSFKNLELSWSGPQKIENFVLVDALGTSLLAVDFFEDDSSLFSLISKGFPNGIISIKGFAAAIIPGSSTTNLEEILGLTIFPKQILNPIHIKNGTGLLSCSNPSHMEMQATGQTQYGDVAGYFNIDIQKSEQDHHWQANINQFPVSLLDAILTFQYPALRGALSNLLGEAINLEVSEAKNNGEANFSIRAFSPIFSTSISGKYGSNNIIITSPASIKLILNPDLLRVFSNNNMPKEWDLAEPTEVQIDFASLAFPSTFFSNEKDNSYLSEWSLQSGLVIPQIAFKNLRHKELNATVNDLSLIVEAPLSTNELAVRFTGSVAMIKDLVRFDFTSSFPKPKHFNNLKKSLNTPLDIQASVKDLPTVLLDVLFETGSWLSDTIGKEVSFKLVLPKKDSRSLHLSLHSANFAASDILVKFDEIFTERQFSGYIMADQLSFLSIGSGSSITNFRMPWKIQNAFKSFNGSFSGIIKHKDEGSFEGNFNVHELSSDNAQIEFACQGKRIPSAYLELFSRRTEITPLFGESLYLNLEGKIKKMNGPLRADVSGEHGKIKLRSHLEEGILKLNEPFEGKFVASSALGSQVLGKAVPLFKELISSQNPITITVFPENFYFPLTSPNLTNFQIGKAVIDVSKMTFSNSGELKNLLGLLHATDVKEVNIWATPLYLSIEKGILSLERGDMLLSDRYHVATWGKVDFTKDNIDMVVGITGQALSHALRIPNLSKEEILQIPLKGKIRNAKIDLAKASARIAAILAKHQGGAEGLIIGTALDIASGKQTKTPLPTTTPFPWGELKLYQKPINSEKEEEPSYPKKSKNSFRDIEKSATKLLNKLLD
jgi:hypothetical protein